MHTQSQSRIFVGRSVFASVTLAALSLAGIIGSQSAHAVVGRDWTSSNPTPNGEDVLAVVSSAAKGGASAPLIVAVGTHGLIMTSADNGTTWIKQASGVTEDLNDVLWGTLGSSAPLYVAVGMNSTVLTSTDGIAWTAKNTPHVATAIPDNLLAVSIASNRFVAVGGNATSGLVFTWDGGATTTWVKGTTGVPEYVTGVTAIGTTVFAITEKSLLKGTLGLTALALTKNVPTGLSLAADSPFSISLAGLDSTTSSKMVMCSKTIAGGACKVWTSTNGLLWTQGTLPGLTSTSLSVRSSNQQIVATGPSGDVWTSPGGAAWTQRPTAAAQLLYSGASIGSSTGLTFIACGEGGRIFTNVPDTSTVWDSRGSTGSTSSLESVASNGTAFVGVGNGFTLKLNGRDHLDSGGSNGQRYAKCALRRQSVCHRRQRCLDDP